ncbi:MAG TPA: hypothetical protein VF319_03625 [Caldimonas sp.]
MSAPRPIRAHDTARASNILIFGALSGFEWDRGLEPSVHLVAIAWGYVVLMMAAAEAASGNGTLLGALFIVLLYGALPLSIAMFLLGTPARRARRRAVEASARPVDPDHGRHASGDPVAPEREEP